MMVDRRNDEYTDSPLVTRGRYDELSTDEIEEEIEHTRGRVDATLNEIQERLSPGRLFDEVVDYFRERPGKFASGMTKTIILNPMPSALIVAGIAWLVASKSGGASGPAAYTSKLRDRLHRFREGAGNRSEEIRGRYGYHATKKIDFSFLWEEQPLLLAAIGLTVGAALAASIPETRLEHEMMGETKF